MRLAEGFNHQVQVVAHDAHALLAALLAGVGGEHREHLGDAGQQIERERGPCGVRDPLGPRPHLREVPVEEARIMYARAGEPKKLFVVPGMDHKEVYEEILRQRADVRAVVSGVGIAGARSMRSIRFIAVSPTVARSPSTRTGERCASR